MAKNDEACKIAMLQGILIGVYQELRKKADYQLANTIRDALKKVGVTIEDTENKQGFIPEGQRYQT